MERQMFLNAFAAAALLLALCLDEVESFPHSSDVRLRTNLREPTNLWKYSRVLQRMAEIKRDPRSNEMIDGDDLDETPSSFGEELGGTDLSVDDNVINDSENFTSKKQPKRSTDAFDYSVQPLHNSSDEQTLAQNSSDELKQQRQKCNACRKMCVML